MIRNIRAVEVDAARKGVFNIVNDGAPTANTGKGMCGKGSVCSDRVNGKAYVNTGTAAAPTWTVVGTQT